MTYHKIWRGLNVDPKDKRSRWNDNYVFKKEWMVYPVIFSNIPLFALGILPYYILSLILPHKLEIMPNNMILDILIVVSPFGLWMFFSIWKLLPYLLKKYGIIIYAPKGVSLT